MNLSNVIFWIQIFLNTGVFSQFILSEPTRSPKFNSSLLKVKATSISNPSAGSLCYTAIRVQLGQLQLKSAKSIAEWISYYQSEIQFFGNVTRRDPGTMVAQLYEHPLTHSFVLAFGALIIFGVGFPVVSLVFGCLRCCNRCGGRNPSPNGYPIKHIFLYILTSSLVIAIL
jgi:hypothetical protein